LEAAVGKNWWTTAAVPKDIHDKARRYRKNELKEAWHGGRGSSPVQYIDLPDLVRLVEHNWDEFKTIFPRKNWFGSVVDDLNVSRRVVAHMNALTAADVTQVEAGFAKWMRQLQSVQAQLPT